MKGRRRHAPWLRAQSSQAGSGLLLLWLLPIGRRKDEGLAPIRPLVNGTKLTGWQW